MALTRDQKRACHAYERVKQVQANDLKDYKVLVNSLGPNIIRSGLVASLSFLQRYKGDKAKQHVVHDLSKGLKLCGVLAEEYDNVDEFADCVRKLESEKYMLTTRETLKLVQWLKRALQARETEDKSQKTE